MPRRRRHWRSRTSRRAIAKAAGFTTIAISHSTDKDKLVRELGADEIVRDGKGLAAIGGADVILGTSNSVDAMADSIAGLRPDGRLVLMGFENKPLAVHPGDLIMRRIRILGSQQNDREYLYEALQIAASGKVKVMTETYQLEELGAFRLDTRLSHSTLEFSRAATASWIN
jgi:alcohol dehydrogenase